ncbi:C39 family peptidase [Melissospora conviva]|uniref:C39 family peptidase n=1 Tax=Melissospora conviva TaxID=3388432 RepID=UPI003C14EDB3
MNRIKKKAAALVAQRPYHAVAVSALLLALTSSSGFLVTERAAGDSAEMSPASVEFAPTGPAFPEGAAGAAPEGSGPADPDLSPSTEPQPAESEPAAPQPTEPQPTEEAPAEEAPAEPEPAPAPPAAMTVDYQYQVQNNYYYCGPAATRIALTARGANPSQDAVASKLGTTVFGTNSAHETTRVLNEMAGTDFYQTRSIPGPRATPAQMDQLQADVVHAVTNGYAVVANIAGTLTDVDGGWHSYDGGHYVTIVGYADEGRRVQIADPANAGVSSYWMTTIDMANWIATRGYSA